MIEQQISDLNPFMKLTQSYLSSEIAADADVWIENIRGRGRITTTQPTSMLCRVIRADTLGLAQEPTVPTAMIEWPSGRTKMYLPDTWVAEPPYEGRQWVRGEYDCFSLVADYYKRETDYDMTALASLAMQITDTNTMDGVFHEHPEYQNWETITNPDIGDGIFFNVNGLGFGQGSNLPNHCGVYLGEGNFLHHFSGRLSCVESLNSEWKKYVLHYVRQCDG